MATFMLGEWIHFIRYHVDFFELTGCVLPADYELVRYFANRV